MKFNYKKIMLIFWMLFALDIIFLNIIHRQVDVLTIQTTAGIALAVSMINLFKE